MITRQQVQIAVQCLDDSSPALLQMARQSGKKTICQITNSLRVYKDRGELDGTLNTAIECLQMAGYEVESMGEKNHRDLIQTLRTQRKGRLVSQKELAQMSGVGATTIGNFEKASHDMTLKKFCKLADALGFEVYMLKKIGHN